MKVTLDRIATARSGDKGEGSNVGVIAHSDEAYAYLREALGQPSLDELMQVAVTLSPADTGWIAARPGLPAVTLTIGEL